ncbi:Olfactory receptor 1F12 [Plecturocebus cupreus]
MGTLAEKERAVEEGQMVNKMAAFSFHEEVRRERKLGVVAHTCNPSTLGGQGRWIIRSRDRDHGETLSLLKNTKISWAQWHAPVVPATQEADGGESLEPGRRRLQVSLFLLGLERDGLIMAHNSLDFSGLRQLCHLGLPGLESGKGIETNVVGSFSSVHYLLQASLFVQIAQEDPSPMQTAAQGVAPVLSSCWQTEVSTLKPL